MSWGLTSILEGLGLNRRGKGVLMSRELVGQDGGLFENRTSIH